MYISQKRIGWVRTLVLPVTYKRPREQRLNFSLDGEHNNRYRSQWLFLCHPFKSNCIVYVYTYIYIYVRLRYRVLVLYRRQFNETETNFNYTCNYMPLKVPVTTSTQLNRAESLRFTLVSKRRSRGRDPLVRRDSRNFPFGRKPERFRWSYILSRHSFHYWRDFKAAVGARTRACAERFSRDLGDERARGKLERRRFTSGREPVDDIGLSAVPLSL